MCAANLDYVLELVRLCLEGISELGDGWEQRLVEFEGHSDVHGRGVRVVWALQNVAWEQYDNGSFF